MIFVRSAHAQAFLNEAAGITDEVSGLVGVLNLFGLVMTLLSPALIALIRKHPDRFTIAGLTTVFGWTGVVWAVMLVKSLRTPEGADCPRLGLIPGLTIGALVLLPFIAAISIQAFL
jgi:hypothetical protein